MSLFGRIKSAVVGNPVTKEYELGRHIASAGPGLMWKVYSATKKTTRQEVSVFIFDKKAPEFDKMPKKQREAICEMLKKGPTHLIKLRHPRLLTIEHQVEESNDTIAFATEPVFVSLANVLGYYDNLPSPLPLPIKEYEIHPIEIQYGLLQLAEALSFLHGDVRMMHGNLTPSAIAITKKGTWKLMGFNFCCYSQYQSGAQTSFQFREWDSRKHVHTNPSLDYLAPEYILSQSCSELSDIYSFGMLSYAVYNQGKPLCENNNNMLTFKANIEQVSRISESALGQVPAEFRPFVRSTLAVEPSVRPDALQITKQAFFDEVAVSTLKYLDQLYEKGDMEKSQFFKKNLARVMTKLPQRIVQQRVLPALSSEFRNNKMIPFVLPLVLLIAEDCTLQDYCTLIMPVITPALHMQDPIQIPLIFLQKMDLLLKKTPQDEVKGHVLPMILASLETENRQVQELCVNILPTFASMMDYSSMKHSIIPRITALCASSRETSLQIKCLVCLGQMLDILDKHIVLDHILPILEQIPTREPGVLMAVLGIYHQTLTHKKLGIDKQMLACRVLPFLIPLTLEPALNLKQFNQFMKVIREMLHKVEMEQQAHLDQLSKMEEQTKSTVEFAREVSEAKAMDDTVNKLEQMFSGGGESPASGPRRGTSPTTINWGNPKKQESGTSDLLSGLTVNDMASTLSASSATPPTANKSASPAVGMGMGPSNSNFGMGLSSSTSNNTPSPQFPRPGGFQQASLSPQQQQRLQPTTLQPPTLQPTPPSATPSSGSTLQPSKYAPLAPKQATLSNLSGGMDVQSGYTPPTVRSQQTGTMSGSGGGSGLGDFGLLTGRTGQTSQTGFGSGGGGGSGMLQPTKPQSGLSMMGVSNNTSSVSTSGSLFSGMQTQTGGTGGFNQQTQGNRSTLNPSYPGSSGTMSGTGDTSGLFSGMRTNNTQQQQQQFSNQSMQGGMGGSGVGGGGLLQPMVPTQQQQQPQPSSGQPIGNASTGWSSNISAQSSGQTLYGGGVQQSQSQTAGGWSSNIAGSSNMSLGSTGIAGSGQNMGGMGMQPMQTGMGPTQMQSGMGMGQGAMGGGASWSTNISGGGANTGVAFQGGSSLPPTAASLMMGGGAGQPLMPQPQQQQTAAPNKPAPGANPFADLSFLA